MPSYDNIDKSGFRPREWIGYGGGGVFRIRRGPSGWIATENEWPFRIAKRRTLRDLSIHFTTLPCPCLD